jgi:hypothetical protein
MVDSKEKGMDKGVGNRTWADVGVLGESRGAG